MVVVAICNISNTDKQHGDPLYARIFHARYIHISKFRATRLSFGFAHRHESGRSMDRCSNFSVIELDAVKIPQLDEDT